jgi:4-oxalocrotonate tautomerase
MPTLEVYLPQGASDARKAALIASLTQATGEAIGAPAESVRILLSELPETDFGVGGRTAADGAPHLLPVIIAILIAGRTVEQKRALIHALTEASATTLETRTDATRVMIKDIPNTDFGIGGKTASSLGR